MITKVLSAICLVSTVLVLFPASACSNTDATSLDTITVQLKWTHQAQFAGLYVAAEKGYYEDEGISVSFIEGGPDVDIVGNTVSGKADFLITSPEDILTKRSKNIELTAIAAIYRRSAVVFAATSDSGILRPADFQGKTIAASSAGGASEFEILLTAMLNKLEIDTSTITVVPYDAQYATFLDGKADITPAYYTGGVIKLRDKGQNLNLIWPTDYGIHFYSDLIATTDRLIEENPDLVERFLRASLQGWQTALENTDQAINITMQYAPESNQEFQMEMLEAAAPLIHTGVDEIGWMRPDVWESMYDILLNQNLLEKPFDYKKAYSLDFVTAVYEEGSN